MIPDNVSFATTSPANEACLPIPLGPDCDPRTKTWRGFSYDKIKEHLPEFIKEHGPVFYIQWPEDFAYPVGSLSQEVRGDRRSVYIADPELLQVIFENHELFNKRSMSRSCRRAWMYVSPGDALFTAEDVGEELETYESAKRLLQPSFGQKAMERYTGIVVDNANQLLQDAQRVMSTFTSVEESLDLCDLCARFAFETISKVAFNVSQGALDLSQRVEMLETLETLTGGGVKFKRLSHEPRSCWLKNKFGDIVTALRAGTCSDLLLKGMAAADAFENWTLRLMNDVLEDIARKRGVEVPKPDKKMKVGLRELEERYGRKGACGRGGTIGFAMGSKTFEQWKKDSTSTEESRYIFKRLLSLREKLLVEKEKSEGVQKPQLDFTGLGGEQLGCPFSGKSGTCPVTGNKTDESVDDSFQCIAEKIFLEKDQKSGKYLTMENICSQFVTFAVAGHDSTQAATCLLLYNLMQNPDVERKLYNEILEYIGPDGEVTLEKLGKMKYLEMCMKESLRLATPAPDICKESPPDQEVILQSKKDPTKKYRIEPATTITLGIWGMHMNPEVYPDPTRFNPENFNPENVAKRNAFTWLPFSYGKRGCIGQQLSLLEQRVMTVKFVQKFHGIIDVQGTKDMHLEHDLFSVPKGIRCRIFPKQPPLSRVAMSRAGTEKLDMSSSFEKVAGFEKKSLVVLYGSNMGGCEEVAQKVVEFYSALGFGRTVSHPLDSLFEDTKVLDVLPPKEAGLIIVVTSTYNGLPPDNAKQFSAFVDRIKGESATEPDKLLLEKFKAARFQVFGCGNKQWAGTFMAFGTKVNDFLANIACAVPLSTDKEENFAQADADAANLESVYSQWIMNAVQSLLEAFKGDVERAGGLSEDFQQQLESLQYPAFPKYDVLVSFARGAGDLDFWKLATAMQGTEKKAARVIQTPVAWSADVLTSFELTDGKQQGRSVRHVEVNLPKFASYGAGDHLGVLPFNPDSVVFDALSFYGLGPTSVLQVDHISGDQPGLLLPMGIKLPAFVVLGYFFELQQTVGRVELYHLLEYVPKENTVWREKLTAYAKMSHHGGPSPYDTEIKAKSRTLLELVQEIFQTNDGKPDLVNAPPIGDFLGMLPTMKPRLYSISSSPKTAPDRISATVSVVEGQTPTGRTHLGVASNYLGRTMEAGRTLRLDEPRMAKPLWEDLLEKLSSTLQGKGQKVTGKELKDKLLRKMLMQGGFEDIKSPLLNDTAKAELNAMLSERFDMEINQYPASVTAGSKLSNRRTLMCFVRQNPEFKLPPSRNTPIIMVGPGTGFAPMRGFLQDREAQEGSGENVLFFGCRDDGDYLYREDLEKMAASGFLDLNVAFSRKQGSKKVYVQDKLREKFQDAAFKELFAKGAHIYVCGDASSMAPAVRSTFQEFLGEDYVSEMEKAGRYQVDVWAK